MVLYQGNRALDRSDEKGKGPSQFKNTDRRSQRKGGEAFEVRHPRK